MDYKVRTFLLWLEFVISIYKANCNLAIELKENKLLAFLGFKVFRD